MIKKGPAHYAIFVREFVIEVFRLVDRPPIAALTGAFGVATLKSDVSSCENALWGFITQKVAQKRYR
jgi:hypothetical protein